MTPEDLLRLRPRDLRALFASGTPVSAADLEGRERDGLSLMPSFARRLVWTKFKKTFLRDGGTLRGWNVAAEQTPLSEPWRDALRGGLRKTYGYYEVHEGTAWGHPGTQVIAYGPEEGGLMRPVYDPLVALPGTDVLLSYSAIGGRTLPFTWFALFPGRPLTYAQPRRTP